MPTELHRFVIRLIGTMALAVAPVILTSFISLPMNLAHHPGEALAAQRVGQHMS